MNSGVSMAAAPLKSTQAPRSARSSGESWSSATTSVMPMRPPGLRTRVEPQQPLPQPQSPWPSATWPSAAA